MALPYTLREGLAGFRRARVATAASVVALALALVLIGLFALLGWRGHELSQDLQQRASELEAFLRPLDAEMTARVGERLRALPGVDSVRYVSHEEASEIFRADFGAGAGLYEDEQFLPASYRVMLAGEYAAPDSVARVAARVQSWAAVEDVAYDEAFVAAFERNRRAFTTAGLGVAALVVLASLLLVGNTVRLSIYARRMLIRTMKLVGATNGFIRRPFLVEGLAQGVLAGALAGVLLWLAYGALLEALRAADALGAGAADWPGGSPLPTMLGLVGLGALLGLVASWAAVRRFIRGVGLS